MLQIVHKQLFPAFTKFLGQRFIEKLEISHKSILTEIKFKD